MNITETLTRRSFMDRAAKALFIAVGAIIGVPSVAFGVASGLTSAVKSRVRVASFAELSSTPTAVPVSFTAQDAWRQREPQKLLVFLRREGNTAHALSARCTHLGCTIHWDTAGDHFVCPCHGSQFSAAGEVTRGPANRPLDSYPVTVSGNDVFLEVQP